jgi:hypothetical protein
LRIQLEVNRKVFGFSKFTLFFVLVIAGTSISQKTELRFGAASVYTIASKLTGDSTCWPIIVLLSERDAVTNGFILNSRAQDQIKDFSTLHKKVIQARINLSQHIKSGAKVFATEELDSATACIKSYDTEVRNGNIAEVRRIGQRFEESVRTIEKLIAVRRTEAIDAKLAQKTGTVDKRKGLLGQWQSTLIGDLFAPYDGIRTGVISFAQLFFTDGVDVTIDPNSIVVIRESHLDKLDQTVRRDLALMNGSILTKLSAKAKETNRFSFRAGTSESTVKSGKFWASALQDRQAKLSNYDGSIDLTASNVKVTLQQNQGTVVEKGKAPLPPINLLSAPQLKWERLDSVVYTEKLHLQWTRIEKASSYQVEVCSNKNFDNDIKRFQTKIQSIQLNDIPLSSIYIRVQAVDKYGLRGVDSPIYRIMRVKDTQPPPIQIDGWEMDRKYTANDTLTIKGKTKADATLTIDGNKRSIQSDGSFSFRVPVIHPETQLKIIVIDQSGNMTTRKLSIVPMETEKLFQIQWHDRTDETTVYPQGESVEMHGSAYPGVRVTATLGEQHMSVQTNSQGDWAISVKAIKGNILKLTFDSIDDGKNIGSKAWKVE